MKNTIIILGFIFPTLLFAQRKYEVDHLRYTPDFIFEFVLEKKFVKRNPAIPFPSIHTESKTPLKEFQDAIFPQWGWRPEYFTNAFALHANKIFLIDDAEYYRKHERCMDDSLAHELVHYVQGKYQGWDLNDDSLEWQAIEIQTEFRDAYCK